MCRPLDWSEKGCDDEDLAISQKLMKRHARLVDEMATTLAVDLADATMRRDLPVGDLSDLVPRCIGAEACENWLKVNALSGAELAPFDCMIAPHDTGLRHQLRASDVSPTLATHRNCAQVLDYEG